MNSLNLDTLTSPRIATLLFTLLSFAAPIDGLAADASPNDKRPNILFCFADDWGWPHGHVYGDEVVRSPALDRIARNGVLFEHAFVSSPSCTPSRNAVITGQAFYRLGEGANLHSTLDRAHPNFVSLLEDAGYQVGHYRKAWGPGDFTAGGYQTHPCGPNSTFDAFIAKLDTSKPFCFWFGTSDPHRPYKLGSGRESGLAIDKIDVPPFYPDEEIIRSDIADYYFEVERFNNEVDLVLDKLEQMGLSDNTIVVISGDHGMPFPRCKGNLYDGGTRVPLAIRWPSKVPIGRRVSDLVSLTDLAPTFLEAAGVRVPAQMTGRSLLPILSSKAEGRIDSSRNAVIVGRQRHTPAQESPSINGYPSRGIRTDEYLLIVNFEPDRWPAGVPSGSTHPINSFADCDNGPTKSRIMECNQDAENQQYYDRCFARRPAEELYVLADDPAQVDNRIDDPSLAEVAKILRNQLYEKLRETNDPLVVGNQKQASAFDRYPYRAKYELNK
ncbi:Sulfatase [Novipirellula aureliae]|uniref:Sulfatase n=1 Tax=Novipirellula aureliae TaxID=2527966 RepID=A0A5C6E213_9BACT|nr:sulfatase [Novipirellula aureliae]TWU42940.1 Sulfatase [Novipirellula aureliae]